MDQRKYIGMDVHQASISIAVSDSRGKLVMDSVIETKATTVLGFIKGLNGSLWVTFEEGTSAAWLYDLLKPHVTKMIVCDPRRNALLKAGNKNDRVDALSRILGSGYDGRVRNRFASGASLEAMPGFRKGVRPGEKAFGRDLNCKGSRQLLGLRGRGDQRLDGLTEFEDGGGQDSLSRAK
jgi:hypothetical protein